MSLDDFQLIDNETIDNSIIKREFLKIYHQQAATLNDSDQNVEYMFGENNNCHQIGNAYLQYELTVEKDVANVADRIFVDADVIRLVNNALAYWFKEARLSVTEGSDIEHNKYCGQVSTILRVLTIKDGDLLSHLDKIDESQAQIENISLKHLLNNNHNVEANDGKIKEQLPFELTFGFCKTFKKITKQLGFHLTFKTTNLQDVIYTSANDIKVVFDNFFIRSNIQTKC